MTKRRKLKLPRSPVPKPTRPHTVLKGKLYRKRKHKGKEEAL